MTADREALEKLLAGKISMERFDAAILESVRGALKKLKVQIDKNQTWKERCENVRTIRKAR